MQGYPQKMRLQRRHYKLLKSSKFIGASVFTFCQTLVDIYKNIGNKNTVSDLLQSTEFVKTRLDKLSTVVVESHPLWGNPVEYLGVVDGDGYEHILFSVMPRYKRFQTLDILIIANVLVDFLEIQ